MEFEMRMLKADVPVIVKEGRKHVVKVDPGQTIGIQNAKNILLVQDGDKQRFIQIDDDTKAVLVASSRKKRGAAGVTKLPVPSVEDGYNVVVSTPEPNKTQPRIHANYRPICTN